MLKNEKYPLVSVVMAVYNNMEEQVLRPVSYTHLTLPTIA